MTILFERMIMMAISEIMISYWNLIQTGAYHRKVPGFKPEMFKVRSEKWWWMTKTKLDLILMEMKIKFAKKKWQKLYNKKHLCLIAEINRSSGTYNRLTSYKLVTILPICKWLTVHFFKKLEWEILKKKFLDALASLKTMLDSVIIL